MRALCEFLRALLYAFASLREKNNRKDKADSNKCAKAFCLLPTACCLLFLTTANAQVYPVQGTAALIPPYALRLSDYTTSATDRFVLNALLADVTKAELHVRFRISIVSQNVKLETKPEYIGSPITLQGGIPLRLTNVELAEYFDPNHLNFSGISKNDFLKTGFLPEGFYQFCFEVYEYNRGVKISNTICAPAWLILNDPPLINLPLSGSKLKPLSPQNVIFQWTPRHMGSPNAAFTTEYDVKVVEVWPVNRNPNDAILTQPSIYETTTNSTTLIYGPDATQLEPGRVYAFRVQARAMAGAEQLDLFKNNGYSETVTFIYGDACDAPINVVAEASTPTRISLQWDASPSQTGYTVQYRPSSPSPLERGPGGEARGEAWYSSTSLIPGLEISGLQPNTTYEYQLMSNCGSFESSYGNLASITTPDMAQKGYTCGLAPENFNLDPSQLIPVLKVGEVINAGDFDVTLTKVTGASGTFSGEGAVVVPFLNQVRGRVKFDNITVNNDKRMVKGYMNVTGGGIEIVPAGVMNAMEQLSQVLSIADSALNLARQFVTPPPDPATFVADTLIVVAGGINKVYKDVATGNIIVVDNSGKSQSLPPGKNMALTDSSGKGVLVDKKGGVGNTTAAQATATAKREYNFSVTFAKASNTNYGFDEQKIDALKSNYEKLGSSYFVTWKAVSQLTSDPVVATFSGKDISADKIKFEQDGTTVSSTATGNSFNLSAGPVAAGVTSALTAKASVGDKEQILGKLNLVGYNSKPMKLKIVLVNDVKFSTNATIIKTQLDKIYSQSVVSWDVEISSSNLKVSNVANPFDDGSSGLLSNYTGDMKSVINAYGELQSDTYYLFLIDKPASGTKQGYMPRSKQAGFIFTEPHGNDATKIVNTMAHELGHGAFTLKHTFADYTSLTQGSTDNLMDYNNGTLLWKYQWDKIHDPAVVLGLFESDEAGASYACQYNWFDSSLPSKDCDNVGKVLEKIRTAINSGKKVGISGSKVEGKEELTATDIKLDDVNYKTIRIQNLVEKDKSVAFDPSQYEDYNPDLVSTDRFYGFYFKIDGKTVFKISVDDKNSEETQKKRESLRKYLFAGEIFLNNVQFVSQFDANIFGQCSGCFSPPKSGNICCMRAAQYMLGNVAVANCSNSTIAENAPLLEISETLTAASFSDNSTVFSLELYNSTTLNFDLSNAVASVKYLKEKLQNGRPILIGVHYTNGSSTPYPNTNRATRHFMVVVGTGTNSEGGTYFRFYDPGNFQDIGTAESNKLSYNPTNSSIQGVYNGRTYSITEVFKTN